MTTPSRAPDIIESEPGERLQLAQLGRAFSVAALRPRLVGPDNAPIEIPESLYSVLCDAIEILRAGHAVSISPLERMLTTTEAGDLLGVSRQYLTRLIEQGEIPFERVGRHRRIRLQDVLRYKTQRNQKRIEALRQLTAEAAALGEYD
jgi:excisionase family DNA binding protein